VPTIGNNFENIRLMRSTILTALRGVLGEETFYQIHKEMHQVWGFKLMSPYDWFAFIEADSDRDLTWFWRAWYYETWTMDQAVESVRETRRSTDIIISETPRCRYICS
jgi:hypothetical protein